MNLFQAIIMGIVQGLTEYLPISSSAHLRLTPVLLGFDDPGAGFSAVIQIGTVIAVLVYFWSDLSKAFMAWFRSLTGKDERATPEAKMGWAVFFGTIPVVIIAPLLHQKVETSFRNLYLVAFAMIIAGLVMYAAQMWGKKNRKLDSVVAQDGWIPGVLQCFALVPGMSRSGSTITGAFLIGFDKEAATRFSFLMSVPSVAGAGFYELYKARHELSGAGIGITATIVATIVSFIVGYASIKFLITWISKHGIGIFTIYRLILGSLLLVLLFNGTLKPDSGAKDTAPAKVVASLR